MKAYSVAIYDTDRAYGGPEEGGWYYDYAIPCDESRMIVHTRFFSKKGNARRYADKLNSTVCRIANEGKPSTSSVLSEGRYEAQVREGYPKEYPTEIPQYS